MSEINQEVVDILKKTKAIISDSHFVYISGKHAKLYVNNFELRNSLNPPNIPQSC